MFLRNCVLIFCLAVSTTLFAQQETYRLFPTCFSDSSNQFGVRKVGEELFVLSTAYDLESNPVIDQYTNKAYTDLYRVDSCKLKLATLKSALIGEEALLSSPKYDGPVSSDKAMTIIFFSNNNEKLIAEKMGIFYLMKTDNGWSESMPFPLNSEKYNVIHPFYSEETGRLYFASDMAQGKGGFDIYSIEFDGVDFGKIYAEDSINTEFNETFPQYANGRVYFTSDGHNSVGGLDIFFSQAGKIIHLPEPINTVYDDFDIHFIDEYTGFLGTNRDSQGAADKVLYFIKSSLLPNEESSKERNPLLIAQHTNLALTDEVLADLLASDKNNTFYKALQLSSKAMRQKQDSIDNQVYGHQNSAKKKLTVIKQQVEELILADKSLDYAEKSRIINQLSLAVNDTDKRQSSTRKERLFSQLTENIISKLDNQPTSLLSNVASYKKDLASLSALEVMQEEVANDMLSLTDMVKQESLKASIQSPSLSQLLAVNGANNNSINGLSSESITLMQLNQNKADQIKLKEYESQHMLLLDKYKRQLINDILSDTAKSDEEKMAVIGQINSLLASSGSFKNKAELEVLASQVSDIQEKAGFKPSTSGNNQFNGLIKLANENTYIIEKSKTDQSILAKSSTNNHEVQQFLASIENSLLKQLVEENKLNQANTDKVAQLLQAYSNKLSNTSDIQESIQLTKALIQSLAAVDSSLVISEQQQMKLLAAHKVRVESEEIRQLQCQLAFARLKSTPIGNQEHNSNEEAFVGIVQLNNQPYQSGKFLVKDADGVIIDSLFTDENGIFSYHKLKSANVTIEPFDSSLSDKIVFYNVDAASDALALVQAKSATNQSVNELMKKNSLTDAHLESKDGKIDLANFRMSLPSDSSKLLAKTDELGSKGKLSNSLMNSLIESYELPLIQFKFDSYHLQRKYNQQLDELVKFLSDYNQFAIKVIGHTDITGDVKYNLLLSEKRAKYVKHYLVRKGLSDASFVVEGVGPRLPISTNDTKEGRKLNRRVEIRLEVK